MRIVYFVEDISETGGVERIVCRKASILCDEYGHDVTIVSAYEAAGEVKFPLSDDVSIVYLGVKRARRDGLRIMRVLDGIGIFIRSLSRLRKALKNLNPDVVFYIWVLGAMLLPFTGGKAKRIFESHSSRNNTPYKFFIGLMERKADMVVTITKGDAAEYKHCKQKAVISNFLHPYPNVLHPDYSVKRVIAAGRLVEAKGFDRLIRMWAEVIKKHKGWTLDIFGVGPLDAALKRLINNYGVEDSVFLRGRTDKIYEEYANHSISLVTSHDEGQSMVLIESQACGLPAVTFDYEYGASDIIENGVNGIIVPQDDEKSFCKSLSEMMYSEQMRIMMGSNAVKIGFNYTKEKIMPQWEALLKQITE